MHQQWRTGHPDYARISTSGIKDADILKGELLTSFHI